MGGRQEYQLSSYDSRSVWQCGKFQVYQKQVYQKQLWAGPSEALLSYES